MSDGTSNQSSLCPACGGVRHLTDCPKYDATDCLVPMMRPVKYPNPVIPIGWEKIDGVLTPWPTVDAQ